MVSPESEKVEGVVAGPVLLNVGGLSKQFPGVKALDDVSLHVRAGEVLALVGENGAGKSTTLRSISGLHRAASGRIAFDGGDITRSSAARIAVSLLWTHFSAIGTVSSQTRVVVEILCAGGR